MPKYLVQANYVGEGVKGLLKEGGSSTGSGGKVNQIWGRQVGNFLLCFRRNRSVRHRRYAGQCQYGGGRLDGRRQWSHQSENNRADDPRRTRQCGKEDSHLSTTWKVSGPAF